MTLTEFIAALNARFAEQGYSLVLGNPGPKYTRVILKHGTGSGSAYCFVDALGNIYKCAGWKTPAKGIRANLATLDISKTDPYGSWLYR